MSLADADEGDSEFPHLLVRDSASLYLQQLKEKTDLSASLNISGMEKENVKAYNVVGLVEGTDSTLKKEHMVMCAHFDHVGIQPGEEGQDSIYNGTRDNGIGTTGLINAAKYFGKYPPKRSVIIIALTGEEKGLLGSSYYVDYPKIPLKETVFAFNIDNSGYTDTEVLTLLDTSRTNIDELVYQAASEVGLGVIGDRIPNQNYYERSDQVSFAQKGVPAVNFKMSMTAFDERISKYYHQPTDEFHTVDLDYIHKYWKAYIRAAELIGNWEQRPYWIKGDKFESAGNELYKLD
jgi:Zn-dependent M28 family amino/carboxypeptidase